LLAWLSTYLTSCKKDILLSKDYLSFSVDTVLFDTIFTTVGSTTKRFKIYNKNDRPVKVSTIYLKGGTSSPYRVNLDGVSGLKFNNITIPANDSLFMFVEVTLGENSGNTPFIIEDEVIFETNGKEQSVLLAAWGQNAYFYHDTLVSGVWGADKPHVIYNLAVVDSLQNLTIQAGAKIHFHKQSMLYINSGSLDVQGTFSDKVIFEGDRLEPFYKDVKGQWYGIYFNKAQSSTIDNAIIKNGTAGIHVYGDYPSNSDYTLKITNTEIYNHSSYGIFNYSGGRIDGENISVHNNGVYAFLLLEGGDFNFRHSQFISYGTESNSPAFAIKNYFTRDNGVTYIGSINEGNVYNSIIDGGGETQLGFDTIVQAGVTINYNFDTDFIKNDNQYNTSRFTNIFWNKNIKYKDVDNDAVNRYIITTASPCVNKGNPLNTTLFQDIVGNSRGMPTPDVGPYEAQ